jgi:Phage tail assembly chaperone proteins, E, or 41 or 14
MKAVKLKQPIEAYGDTVTEITFREPTGKDIRKCGVMFKSWTDESGVVCNGADAEAVARSISHLGNLPMGAVDALSAHDFMECMQAVTSFFSDADGPDTRLTGFMTSPGNGALSPKAS